MHEYQKEFSRKIIETPRLGIFMGMGGGKTVLTLDAISTMLLCEMIENVLIVAPKQVAVTVWSGEASGWEHTKKLKVSICEGNIAKRTKALSVKADIYTINYESLVWLSRQPGIYKRFSMIIADESTKLKSFRGEKGRNCRTKALASFAFSAKRFLLLTGTPAPNGLQDLWGQIYFLDRGVRLEKSYYSFEKKWFHTHSYTHKLTLKEGAEKEIMSAIGDITHTFNVSDHLSCVSAEEEIISFQLPPSARAINTALERELFVELKKAGDTVTAASAALLTGKCLQNCSGGLYIDHKEGDDINKPKKWSPTHLAKIDALKQLLTQTQGSVLIAYRFKFDLINLKKHFPQGVVLGDKLETIEKWNRGEIPILFAHPASAGHGLSLQHGGNTLIFYTIDWNFEHHLQIQARLGPVRQKQSGYDRPSYVYYIICENSVEELVYRRLTEKESIQDLLFGALASREKNKLFFMQKA